MEIVLREALIGDCEAILLLVNELALYEKAPQEVTVTLAEFRDAGFGQKPVWQAFVAEVNQVIVGVSLFYVRFSTWKGRQLYLEDFIVTQTMRGKGIGKILFERTVKEAKNKGYFSMVWQVLDWNVPALNFYQKYNAGIESGWLNGLLTKQQLNQFDF